MAERVSELRELAELAGTAPLKAVADRAEGVARGDRALLEDAVDGFAGAPYEAGAGAARPRRACSRARARDARRASGARRRRGAARLGAGPPLPELTKREREVLVLSRRGSRNRQLAERLVVSEHTVHRHVTNILRKLDVADAGGGRRGTAARHGLDIARSGDARGPGRA